MLNCGPADLLVDDVLRSFVVITGDDQNCPGPMNY